MIRRIAVAALLACSAAAPAAADPFDPCPGALKGVSLYHREGGALVIEEPDVQQTDPPDTVETQRFYADHPHAPPARVVRLAYTYLRTYSSAADSLVLVCFPQAGQQTTVHLPVGTASCELASGLLSCR